MNKHKIDSEISHRNSIKINGILFIMLFVVCAGQDNPTHIYADDPALSRSVAELMS